MHAVFGEAGHGGVEGEEASGEAVVFGKVGAGGGDVEGLEVGATEGATGDVGGGHFESAVEGSVGSDAEEARAAVTAVPEIAGRIDSRAIGHAARVIEKEGLLVRDSAGFGIVVVAIDGVGEAIGEVEEAAVRTPGERVGDADIPFPLGGGAVPFEAVENAVCAAGFKARAIGSDVVAHGADPECATGVDTTIVEADSGRVFQAKAGVARGAGARLPEDDFGGEGNGERVVVASEGERGDRLIEEPRLDGRSGRVEAVDEEAVDVSPIESLFGGMPEGTFAADVGGGRDTDGFFERGHEVT